MGFFQSLKDDLSEAVDGMDTSFEELLADFKEQKPEDEGAKDCSDPEDEALEEHDSDDYNGEDIAALLGMAAGDIPDPDEDYVPATPEEIAEFESSSDEDETEDEAAIDMSDLDKLMADLQAMQENEKDDAESAQSVAQEADESAAGEPDRSIETGAKEAAAEDKELQAAAAENAPADKQTEDAASESAAAEDREAASEEDEKAQDKLPAGAEEEPGKAEVSEAESTVTEDKEADGTADTASEETAAEETTAEDNVSGETVSEETASKETDSEAAASGDPAAENSEDAPEAERAKEAEAPIPDNGEQMTIEQMIGTAGEDDKLIKKAEAMAEAAAIADIKEAVQAAKEAQEEATAEDVAAFEVDSKPAKRGRKKPSKADKNKNSDKAEAAPRTVSDENAVFAEGMSVKGNVESDGSLELCGSIEGNIDIAGKLKVSGIIKGNTKAGEIYADGAEINGDISCSGSVKVGQSTIIIGNISGSSAVIAGAVKGNIDVQGPVILDSVAIVMGDIRSQSLQISNGAAVEGMCSQIYSPITPSDFFGSFDK